MNNVDRPGGGLGKSTQFLNQNTFGRNLGDRRGLGTDFLDDDSFEFDKDSTETSSTAKGVPSELLKSFRAAVRVFKDKNDEKEENAKDQLRDLRTLAIAEQRVWTGLPEPAHETSATAGSSSSAEAKIASITEAIDRSIRAEMAANSGAPLTIKIAFSDESLGLAGVKVTVTQTTLEVIFERDGSVPSEALARAAQALAERLMTRFSKKTVRILDAAVTHEPANPEQSEATVTAPFKPFL